MKINKELIGLYGIDRIKFRVNIEAVNMDSLKHTADLVAVAIEDDKNYKEMLDISTGEYIPLKHLKKLYRVTGEAIAHKEKDDTKYGIELKTSTNGSYAVLEAVLPRILYGSIHNIYNISTPDDLDHVVEVMVKELEADGIILNDSSLWEVINIELNRTIEADNSLEYYKRIMDYISDKMFAGGKIDEDTRKRSRNKNGDTSLIYKFNTKRRSKKFYDKTAHVMEEFNVTIEEHLIRYELTLDGEAVARSFRGNLIHDIKNFKHIEDIIKKSLKEIELTVVKGIEDDIEEIVDNIRAYNVADMKRLYDTLEVFDVKFIGEAFKRSAKRNKKRYAHLARDRKKLESLNRVGNYRSLLYILRQFEESINLLKTFNDSKWCYMI